MTKIKYRSPILGNLILRIFLNDEDYYQLSGDMEEVFISKIEDGNRIGAFSWYWLHIVKSLPGFLTNNIYWSAVMLNNYFKIAMRNLLRHKGYSFINISGLALGTACCILISLWVSDETGYDNFNEYKNRLYRLEASGTAAGETTHFAMSSGQAPVTFTDELASVESYTRVLQTGRQFIRIDETSFEESGFYLADSMFFDLFTHQFLSGDPSTVLEAPSSAVLTESTASKFFPGRSPAEVIGSTFTMGNLGEINVTCVIRDVPRKTHFEFDAIVSLSSMGQQFMQNMQQWFSIQGWSYLLLAEGVTPEEVTAQFPDILEKYTGEDSRQFGLSIDYELRKVTDIHLYSNKQIEMGANGNISYVYLFATVAMIVLIIACVNFMNLSTARSAKRANEVGLRKVFGAYRSSLVKQFLSESVLFSALSLVVSIGLVALFLPTFNDLSGKTLSVGAIATPFNIGVLIMIMIITGILAGSYPAFFLSAFQPASVLHGVVSKRSKSALFRKVMVVLQFSISVSLISTTFIVSDQIEYLKTKNLGFENDQVLVVPIQTNTTMPRLNTLKQELLQNAQISNASFSTSVPGRIGELRISFPEGFDESESFAITVIRPDHDFIDVYGMHILAGRNFSQNFSTDTLGTVILNETAVKTFGWTKEETLGRTIKLSATGQDFTIIGVVQDFHYASLREDIGALMFIYTLRGAGYMSLNVSTENLALTIDFVIDKWKNFDPEREVNYFFIDEDFAAQYIAEEHLGELFSMFSIFTILIACLGLFGLASYMAEQRTKEIGIRKILGASVNNIVVQLSKDFAKWVIVANLIAGPITYYLITEYWLINFPYRIEAGIMTFVYVGILSLVIALLTVGYQSVKAAYANPVDSLKYE